MGFPEKHPVTANVDCELTWSPLHILPDKPYIRRDIEGILLA